MKITDRPGRRGEREVLVNGERAGAVKHLRFGSWRWWGYCDRCQKVVTKGWDQRTKTLRHLAQHIFDEHRFEPHR